MNLLDVDEVKACTFVGDINRLGQRAAIGDKQALAQLLSHPEFRGRVQQICRKVCSTSVSIDPDDLEQDFYIRVLTRILQFRGTSSILTWSTIIIRRIYFDLLRKAKHAEASIEEDDRILEEESVDSPARSLALFRAYEELTDREKTLLKMKASGVKLKDIAFALNLKTKRGNLNVKAACQELNSVLMKLDKSIQGW